jgi:vacuolar protein-sorting-associated protein 4
MHKLSQFPLIIFREARTALMKMHLGSTPAKLTESDWVQLGDETEGYSGSDLANCTSDALFEPIRELQHATLWRQNQG